MMFIMWFSGKLQLKILRTGKKKRFISFIVWPTLGGTGFSLVEQNSTENLPYAETQVQRNVLFPLWTLLW